MRKEAKYVHRHHQKIAEEPWYRLSAWTDVKRRGESDVEALQRLVIAAGLGSIRLDEVRNSVVWWTTAAQIYDAGFSLVKDGEPDEPKEHYSIDLGNDPGREIVDVLAGLFKGPRPT